MSALSSESRGLDVSHPEDVALVGALLLEAVGDGRGDGLVDDTKHVHARDENGILGRLVLRDVEVVTVFLTSLPRCASDGRVTTDMMAEVPTEMAMAVEVASEMSVDATSRTFCSGLQLTVRQTTSRQ